MKMPPVVGYGYFLFSIFYFLLMLISTQKIYEQTVGKSPGYCAFS